jgi:hypothetical protein
VAVFFEGYDILGFFTVLNGNESRTLRRTVDKYQHTRRDVPKYLKFHMEQVKRKIFRIVIGEPESY